jgi:hypothetical protein
MQPNLFSNFGLGSHLTTEGKTSIQITTFVTRQDPTHLTIPFPLFRGAKDHIHRSLAGQMGDMSSRGKHHHLSRRVSP